MNTMQIVNHKINMFCKTNQKLHYLNNESIIIKHGKKRYLIVGTTLWSWIPPNERQRIQLSMNDYSHINVITGKGASKNIRKLTAIDVCRLHNKAVKYIKKKDNASTPKRTYTSNIEKK